MFMHKQQENVTRTFAAIATMVIKIYRHVTGIISEVLKSLQLYRPPDHGYLTPILVKPPLVKSY